jgi:membrane-associated phospholipid phosphatase
MGDVQVDSRTVTVAPRPVRVASMLTYVVALTWWVTVMGIPKQALPAIAWIWLATIAWNIQAPWRAHLAFLRDWSIPLAVLMVYLYSRGIADDLGFVSVHVTAPIKVDRWLFGGTLPTEYLQAKLCGNPCERTTPRHWYDVVLTTVYYSHFVVALTIAAVLWLRDRSAWVWFMRRYLSLNILALVVYITYPMAPPWLAAQQGTVSGHIARITGRGWYDLKPGDFHQKLSAVGNPVAAMPSLHAAISLFVALYGASRLRSRWRWLLLLYPVTMAFTLVYYAEHYVIDILAGYAVAGLVLWGCARWERIRAQHRPGDVLTEAIPHQVGALARERLSGQMLPSRVEYHGAKQADVTDGGRCAEGRRCGQCQVEGGQG